MVNVLKVQPRAERGKTAANSARRSGMVPAVVYARGELTRELLVNEREFGKLLGVIRGRSTIVDVQVGEEAPVKCIIKQIQRDSVTLRLMHVDFQKIHAHEKITLHVPVLLEGTPAGIKMGGLLDHALRALPIRGLPEDLPASVTVDITHLKLGQSVHVSDLKLNKVEILLPPITPIASVLAPRKVEEAVAPTAEAPTPTEGETPKEPEVLSEKKAQERAEERAKGEPEAKGGKAKEEKKK
jgi:large subunit ribosomal protein L25